MLTDEAPRQGEDTKALFFQLAANRDPAVRERLVTAHLGLAHQLARRYLNRGEPYEDLVQVASLAIVKSVDRFEPDRGIEFTTFATRTVIGELKRHFRDKGWAVRAPRRVQELYLELGRATETLSQQLGRSPTLRELATATGATEEAVLEALEAGQGYRTSSIDAAGRNDETLGSHIGSEDASLVTIEDRELLAPALATLAPREQLILQLRFAHGLTQSEIAARVGISQMHVSRLLASSLKRLRSSVAGAGDTHADGEPPTTQSEHPSPRASGNQGRAAS
jgi:RNA polymerase sigma-B factor